MSTKIEWADEVWNPVSGCSKVSPGCANCYAETISHRFGFTSLPWTPENAAENIVLHPGRLEAPLHWRKLRRVFVNSMSDLFHERVGYALVDEIFRVMWKTSRHTYLILTKRPERMAKYLSLYPSLPDGKWHDDDRAFREAVWGKRAPLPNVWLGVSVENQHFADERIPILLDTPAAVRFVSCEPLLGPMDLALGRWVRLPRAVYSDMPGATEKRAPGIWRADSNPYGALSIRGLGIKPSEFERLPSLDWVIAGGESGPKRRRMDIAWLESLAKQCQAAHVPLFVKQDSALRPGQQGRIPDALWSRKEFPR